MDAFVAMATIRGVAKDKMTCSVHISVFLIVAQLFRIYLITNLFGKVLIVYCVPIN